MSYTEFCKKLAKEFASIFLVGIGTLDPDKILGIFVKQGGYTPEQNMTFHDSSPGFALHGEFRRPMRNSLAHQDMSFSNAGNLKPLVPEFLKIAACDTCKGAPLRHGEIMQKPSEYSSLLR